MRAYSHITGWDRGRGQWRDWGGVMETAGAVPAQVETEGVRQWHKESE
jgi:hypothetical protein